MEFVADCTYSLCSCKLSKGFTVFEPSLIRVLIFCLVLCACAVWEIQSPRRVLSQTKSLRWLNNLGLTGLNGIILSLMMPLLAIDAAQYANAHQLGLMNLAQLSPWLNLVLSLLILDFAIYLQHVLFHRVPWLWRLHRMHHSDQDIDVTTGARFHPVEILLSMLFKIALVLSLGVSVYGVLIFEIVLNACAMFNHSNARLPLSVDHWLRKVVVTPDMHRIHHSTIARETHSNFGFCLSCWDRWFKTYTAMPSQGHQQMQIGLPIFRQPREQWLDRMLTQPFRNGKIN